METPRQAPTQVLKCVIGIRAVSGKIGTLWVKGSEQNYHHLSQKSGHQDYSAYFLEKFNVILPPHPSEFHKVLTPCPAWEVNPPPQTIAICTRGGNVSGTALNKFYSINPPCQSANNGKDKTCDA